MLMSRLAPAVILIFSLLVSTSPLARTTDILPISKLRISIEFNDEELRKHEPRLKFLIDTAYVEFAELFNGPAKKLNGKPDDHLKIKVSHGLSSEADPETIDLGISEAKLYGFYNWEMGVIHEVLHFWSAETFRYATNQEQWFNEGVSEYLTLRLSAKLGIISKDEIFHVFAKPISTYLSAKGIGKLSLREAASTDELKRQHYLLVYHGGYVVGMILDHQIRLKSNGAKSLTDLMREVYASNSRSHPYSMTSLLSSISKSTLQDYTQFFDDYVDGKKIIPVGAYFDIGWLGISQQLGFDVEDPKQKVLLDMLTFE